MNNTAMMDPAEAEARAENRYRFELELEFVQSLANPHYLQALAQENIMEDPSFILYLEYLKYWSEPEYAKFVIYPHALHHLQLLQNPKFREDLKSNELLQLLAEKQFDHWRTWRSVPVKSLPASALLAQAEADKADGTDAKPGHPMANGTFNGNGNGHGHGTVPRTPHPKSQSRHGTPRTARTGLASTPQGTPRAHGGVGTPRATAGTPRPGSNAPTPR